MSILGKNALKGLSVKELKAVSEFNKIVMNYLGMKKLQKSKQQ